MCKKNPGLGHKNFIVNVLFIKMHYLKNRKKWPKLRTRSVSDTECDYTCSTNKYQNKFIFSCQAIKSI